MMEFVQLKTDLKNKAIKKGLCQLWQRKFNQVEDKEDLVKMFLAGIDFCFSNNYPTPEYIEANFKGVCEKLGVYVNEEAVLRNVRKLVFVGNCSAELSYDSYEVAQIYVKDNSELTIEATDHAIITIDCFDRSAIKTNATNYAKIFVNRYTGAEVSLKSDETGIVKVIEHRFKTYQ